jgi:hypothetical protein
MPVLLFYWTAAMEPDGLFTLLADPFNLGIIAKGYILSCLPERSDDNRYKM